MTLLIDSVGAAAGVSAAVPILRLLPVSGVLGRLSTIVRRSLGVVSSRRISDHWKERVLPVYAIRILGDSLRLAAVLALLLATYAGTFVLVLWVVTGSLDVGIERLLAWPPQLIACILAIAWWRLGGLAHDSASPYSATYNGMERLLHRLALDNSAVRQFAFDLDTALAPSTSRRIERPVYIAGLARSGTTLLLELLNATGAFASLSYRNMPFVTAPVLWHRIAGHFYRPSAARERAHGDGIVVNPDSPEAFEEVFWLTSCGPEYVTERGLLPHRPGREMIRDYRRFVGNVLYAATDNASEARYLCKNTNNLLRLSTVREAFPDAVILVPFRHPLAHADSLLRQHKRFLAIHRCDEFSLEYMNWLGHFEFGANLKPFLFAECESVIPADPLTSEYWLEYWRSVYAHLLEHDASDHVVFFNYDALCASPEDSLVALARVVGIDRAALSQAASRIGPFTEPPPSELGTAIAAVYERLAAKSVI